MAAVGGSIVRLAIGGRTLRIAADASANVNLGGYGNAVEPNGDGSARLIKTREAWSITGLAISCDQNVDDHGYIQQVRDSLKLYPMSIEYPDGTVYGADFGQITDKSEFDTSKATVTVSLSGPGKLEKR